MGLSVNVLFAVLWCALGVFALRFAFGRFFAGRGRADVAAAAIVVAFAAGAYWPFSERLGRPTGAAVQAAGPATAAPAPAPASAAPAAAPAVAPSMHDRSVACAPNSRALTGGIGSLDIVQAGPSMLANDASVSPDQGLTLLGWSADRSGRVPAAGVCLVVDGLVASAHVKFGGPRPDVAAAYHRDSLLNSAFEIDLAPRALRPGRHTLRIAARSEDGALWLVPGERTVNVR